MILETISACDKNSEKIIVDYFNQFKKVFAINKIQKILNRAEESCYYRIYLNKNNKQVNWKKYFEVLSNIFDENNYNQTKIYEMWLDRINYYNEKDNVIILEMKIKNELN